MLLAALQFRAASFFMYSENQLQSELHLPHGRIPRNAAGDAEVRSPCVARIAITACSTHPGYDVA